jgi:transporter family-2 protein
MSSIWFTPFIIVAGALQAFGTVMSAQLRVSLSNPWLALTVLFTLNAFFFAGLFAVSPRPLPTMEGISAMPWWAPLAGLTGAVAVFAGLALVDKIGAGPVNGLIITANLLASLAIDHFGLMNMPVHALNVWRVIGGVLMTVGIFLVFRY